MAFGKLGLPPNISNNLTGKQALTVGLDLHRIKFKRDRLDAIFKLLKGNFLDRHSSWNLAASTDIVRPGLRIGFCSLLGTDRGFLCGSRQLCCEELLIPLGVFSFCLGGIEPLVGSMNHGRGRIVDLVLSQPV